MIANLIKDAASQKILIFEQRFFCARSSVDRVLASEAKGRAFDSRRARHKKLCGIFEKDLQANKKYAQKDIPLTTKALLLQLN